MIRYIATFLVIWMACSGLAVGEEFSKEKVRRYSGYVELNGEVKSYIRSLPPEAIVDLVGELDFKRHKGWRNTSMFNLVLMKVDQLDEEEIDYDRDWVFGQLADFLRILALDGDSGVAGVSLLSVGLSKMFHPAMVEVAEELAAGDDERNAKRGRWFLEKHKKWLSTKERDARRLGTRDVRSERTGVGSVSGDKGFETVENPEGKSAWHGWWFVAAAVGCLVAGGWCALRDRGK